MPVKMKLVALPALLLFAVATFAQDTMYSDTVSVSKKTIKLSDSKRTLNAVSSKGISSIQVVQFLWDSSHIGYAQKGIGNSVVVAEPDQPVTAYLQNHINSAYSHIFEPNGVRVLMVVEALRIAEKTGMSSEKAYIRFKGTTYGTLDGSKYLELATADIVRNNGGLDVTHKHKTNIAKAIEELMESTLANVDDAIAQNTAAFTIEGIFNSYTAKRNIPALKDSLQDGVYMTFSEFKANKPSIAEFDVTEKKRKILVVGKGGNTINCWGFVKNGAIARHIGYTVVPISRYQDGYIVTKYLSNARGRNAAVLWSSIGGGIIAGSIVNSTVNLVPADAFRSLSPAPAGTAIDMETGAFIF
ncbi:hypothetical protein [Chitinophaga sp. sic0106]|uniref:hypothetical protein n=1 Tax=Chitinophaga sp. sic0106 TaxID=2854785 RepID=UPI001C43A04A|nr:hypothetical protein [Chitinophaga sp. sic0106]MBV7528680.1 hypothetical protein [Chitinophaga sp. sic0106]